MNNLDWTFANIAIQIAARGLPGWTKVKVGGVATGWIRPSNLTRSRNPRQTDLTED